MEIKVLGKGCPRCMRLEEIVHEATVELGVEATVAHVTDINAIMAYPIMSTPGLVINEKLVMSGRLPRKEEVIQWIKEAQ